MPSSVVTLLLTPEDAERTVLASSEGQIMLALRNPLDVAPTATAGTRTGSLFGEQRRAWPRLPRRAGRKPSPSRRAGAAPPPPPAAAARRTSSRRFGPRSAAPRPFAEGREEFSSHMMNIWQSRVARNVAAVLLIAACGAESALDALLQRAGAGWRPAPRARRRRLRRRRRAPPVDRITLTAGRSTVLHDRLRHHADRRDQSRGRRRHGGRAARSADRRQGARHDQPDHVGRRPARSVRSGGRSRCRRAPAAAPRTVPGRRHHGHGQRGSDHPLGPRLEQRGDAEGRRNRREDVVESEGDQPAAGAGRHREPAGHAAGAVRGSEPQRAARKSGISLFTGANGEKDWIAPHLDAAVCGAELRPTARQHS